MPAQTAVSRSPQRRNFTYIASDKFPWKVINSSYVLMNDLFHFLPIHYEFTVQGFRCSHCNKFYPTEGILRDHMRSHVFNYKCTLCDMSCESPSGLAKHVRYRHMSTRTFPCQLCSHAAKSQQDLDSHMTVHTNGPNFSCYFEGCLYTCKGAYTLDR